MEGNNKIRIEINKNRKTKSSWFFEKMNKSDKTLTRLTKKKDRIYITKIKTQRGI